MENIEKVRKNVQCEKCHVPYSVGNAVFIHVECKHRVCKSCCRSFPNDKCPICNCSTTYIRIPVLEDILTTLKDYEALQNEYAILKQEKMDEELTRENHHKCIECETSDSEQNMQLCETCHELKFENHEDVKRHALCAPCAIKKHMRKGHHIVDFFPYFSAYNFSSHSSNINLKSEQYKNARDLLNATFSRFNAASINVMENYNVLTDMAQRSKTTKKQLEFFEKMEKFIDKSKAIHGEADCDMKNHTTKLEETLAEIKKWYESRMEDCVEESEIAKLPKSENFSEHFLDVDA